MQTKSEIIDEDDDTDDDDKLQGEIHVTNKNGLCLDENMNTKAKSMVLIAYCR